MTTKKTILAVVADEQGEVFEHPDLLMAGANGMTVRAPRGDELIPLPAGSRLFTVPGTPPMGFDRKTRRSVTADRLPKGWGGGESRRYRPF